MRGFHEFIIQKSGVCQQFVQLLLHSHHIVGMAMPDVGNIVDTVQSFLPIFFINVLPSGEGYFERALPVGDRHHRVQKLHPLLENSLNLFIIGA